MPARVPMCAPPPLSVTVAAGTPPAGVAGEDDAALPRLLPSAPAAAARSVTALADLCLVWMTSRLSIARCISATRRSCSRWSASWRRRMRWISFSMAAISDSPTRGSSAACISRSSSIFFSQSATWRSHSTRSARRRSFSPRSASTRASAAALSASISRSSSEKTRSVMYTAEARRFERPSFFAMSALMRAMSSCIVLMALSSRRSSPRCAGGGTDSVGGGSA